MEFYNSESNLLFPEALDNIDTKLNSSILFPDNPYVTSRTLNGDYNEHPNQYDDVLSEYS